MNPLSSRKQLLIAESELNRAQLLQDWETLASEANTLVDQARTLRSLAAGAASLVSVLSGLAASLRRKNEVPPVEKPAWWQMLFKGLGVAGSLWSEFSSQRSSPQDP